MKVRKFVSILLMLLLLLGLTACGSSAKAPAEDMANYIGVTRETMSRKLNSMQEEGIIELQGNKTIILNDLEYLEELN